MSSTELILMVGGNGQVSGLWDDAMASLVDVAERVEARRASHVEMDEQGLWVADMSPSGGPTLPGCALRSEALAAERRWLSDNPEAIGKVMR